MISLVNIFWVEKVYDISEQTRLKIIAVQGSGFQPRDKHSRATGFSNGGIPKNFDLQRGDTPGLDFF